MAFAIQASSSSANMAFAVSMFTVCRAFGQAIGMAIGGVIFQSQIEMQMLMYPSLADKAVEYAKGASNLVQIIQDMSPALPERADLIHSHAAALTIVWVVLCALSGRALTVSLFTKGLSLNVPLDTEQDFERHEKVSKVEDKKPAV